MADAAERPHVVLLELLARAAAVARLAAGQVAADQLVVELDARRHAADDDRQARPVRFAGGDVRELHRVAKPIRGSVPPGSGTSGTDGDFSLEHHVPMNTMQCSGSFEQQ